MFFRKTRDAYEDQVTFIVGGSKGIGKAIAGRLSKLGTKVIIGARGEDQLQNVQEEYQEEAINPIEFRCLDATDSDQVREWVDYWVDQGYIPDYLFNCVGRARPNDFEEIDETQLEKSFHVNVLAPWNTISAALPYLRETEGHIINFSSIAGLFGVFGYSSYGIAKAGLLNFSEVLEQELADDQIHVSVVCPPDTETPGYREEEENKPSETKALSSYGGLWSPEEVSARVLDAVARKKFLIVPGVSNKVLVTFCRIFPGIRRYVLNWLLRSERNGSS